MKRARASAGKACAQAHLARVQKVRERSEALAAFGKGPAELLEVLSDSEGEAETESEDADADGSAAAAESSAADAGGCCGSLEGTATMAGQQCRPELVGLS